MPNPPAQPAAPPPRQPLAPQHPRESDAAPSFDALLRHIRQEVARVLQLPSDARAKEDPALLSLAPSRSLKTRALHRYGSADKAALPPPLKQIDAYIQAPNRPESLAKYLDTRRADLLLDDEGDDKDGFGEPSPDDDRDSDEDAIGSEHPKSPSVGPSPLGNTSVSSPEPRSTVSAPPHRNADQKKAANSPGSVNHTFTGDDRCTNCIMRNNATCVVNSSRQRCDSCFNKRHRCSKVLTPPTRPTRDKSASTAKGKAPAEPVTNGDSASARAPKRKRTTTEDDTKRTEAAKRPTRPTRPTAAASAAAGTSASTSAPVQRPQPPKRPVVQNGNAAASSSNQNNQLSLAALAASASRAARVPTGPVPAQTRQQYYQERLQVISGILGMVQTAVKELQEQVGADVTLGR
ncbi:hypothetical protein C8Q74DRAFT_1213408 [Fomes fomentarius]|nr:hypothetical protein C8Q74DRAFT_1213408 [Fomes fomentarius]